MTKPKKVEEPTAAYQPKPTTEPAKRNGTPEGPKFASSDEVASHTRKLLDVHRDVLGNLAQSKAIAARLLAERKQLLEKLAQ